MEITEQQREELLEAARPLIRWIAQNCHPHTDAQVDATRVILREGVASHGTEEYLRD